MENNLLYFSLGSAVSLATNGVEVGEQQNEQSLNNKMLKSGDIQIEVCDDMVLCEQC